MKSVLRVSLAWTVPRTRLLLPILFFVPLWLTTTARADADGDCKSGVSARVIPGCTEHLKAPTLTVAQRVTALQYRSWAHTDLKAFEAAEADVNEIFKIEPNSATGYGARGRLRHFQGNNDLALNDYNQAVALAQNKYVYLLNRGLFFIRTLNFDPARVDYEAAMALDPKKAAPYLGRAKVFRHNNNEAGALKDLDTAVSVEPEQALAYLDRGELLLAIKQPKRAAADFDKALTLLKTSSRATRGRDSALAMLSTDGTGGGAAGPTTPSAPPAATQPAQPPRPPATAPPSAATPGAQPGTQPAQPVTAQPGATKPGTAPATPATTAQTPAAQVDVLLKEALEFRRAGKTREALAIYDKILAADPEQYTAMLGGSAAFEEAAAYPQAYQGYQKLRGSKAPPDFILFAIEGIVRVAAKFGDYKAAIGEANNALKLNPKSGEALFWRGLSFLRLQRFPDAIADLQKVADTPDGRGLAWEAYALVANGDTAAGLAKAEAALKLNSKLAPAYVARARVALAKGDVATAQAENSRALQVAQIPEATYLQQMITINKLMKPTDAPLAAKRN